MDADTTLRVSTVFLINVHYSHSLIEPMSVVSRQNEMGVWFISRK